MGSLRLLAIGSIMLAIFRLWVVKRMSVELVDEMQRLIASDPRSERVVIDTIEASERGAGSERRGDVATVLHDERIRRRPRRRSSWRSPCLARPITTFPFLMLLATVVTLGFAVGLFFLGFLIF